MTSHFYYTHRKNHPATQIGKIEIMSEEVTPQDLRAALCVYYPRTVIDTQAYLAAFDAMAEKAGLLDKLNKTQEDRDIEITRTGCAENNNLTILIYVSDEQSHKTYKGKDFLEALKAVPE